MKTGTTYSKSRRGSALLIVMCFAILLMVTSMTLHKMSTQLAFTVGNFRKGAEALAVAESGVSDMLERLSVTFSGNVGIVVTNELVHGTYYVRTQTNGATGCIITSTGIVDGVVRVTVLESLGTWKSAWNTNLFGHWGIAADGVLDVNGQGILHASGYSGTEFLLAPGTVVQGDVSCAGAIDNKGTIGGATNEFIEPIELPTFNYNYFLALAGGDQIMGDARFEKNQNQQFEPSMTWSGTDIVWDGKDVRLHTHPTQIMCVRGDVDIGSDTVIRGSIIALGYIKMAGGHIDQAAPMTGPDGSPMPSLMALGGDVVVNSGQTLQGFVYSSGNVQLNGGDVVWGGVICHGTFEGKNDWQVHPGPGGTPGGINPGDGGEVTRVRIGAWLK